MELLLLLKIFFSFSLLGFFSLFLHLYNVLLFNPKKLRSKLLKQGINGPPPSFLYGNIPDMKRIQSTVVKAPIEEHVIVKHDYALTIFPHFERWRNEYGPIFTYSTGNMQILYVSQPSLVKEISLCTSLDLGRPSYVQKERRALFGQGIMASNGAMWVHQRKIIAPEFYMEKIKSMVKLMVESTTSVLESWESKIESEGGIGDIRVDEDLRSFAADVISRACFGSSYSKGRELFFRLRALQRLMSRQSLLVGVPGLRYLPNKNNREIWRLEKEIHSLILMVVKERKETKSEEDLLHMILEGANNGDPSGGLCTTDQFIVDNCKNIYFAGQETTASSASWILMLLASHPEWQDKVRDEVIEVCEGRLPDADVLRKMKMLTMVIQEALRLYPPAPFASREALQDMKFGDVHVPKGINLWIPLLTLHQDPTIWGPDANKFNPERFAHGITSACKLPQAYIPFGFGQRICLGQNFAMVELKIVVSLILSNFSFSVSPKYRHSPVFRFVIEPEHGINLLIRRISRKSVRGEKLEVNRVCNVVNIEEC